MKIIDLLNKIAKGEEVPKKFKIGCHSYELIKYPTCGKEIINYKDEENDYLFGAEYELGLILNDKLELEEKEIEKFDYTRLDRFAIYNNGITKSDREHLDSDFEDIAIKINELIDVINDMRDKE